jgi:hypothetical protein
MPLRLIPPRKGKTPNWGIRGTYLKVAVDRSSGTHRKAVANRVRQQIERAIERGDYPAPRPSPDAPTFLSAAVAYMKAGRSPRYIGKLIEHFGETPLAEIGQAEIDAAAIAMYPSVTPATRTAASIRRSPQSCITPILRSRSIGRRAPRARSSPTTSVLPTPRRSFWRPGLSTRN